MTLCECYLYFAYILPARASQPMSIIPKSKVPKTKKIQKNKNPRKQKSQNPKFGLSKNPKKQTLEKRVEAAWQHDSAEFQTLDYWIFGTLDFWIIGSDGGAGQPAKSLTSWATSKVPNQLINQQGSQTTP